MICCVLHSSHPTSSGVADHVRLKCNITGGSKVIREEGKKWLRYGVLYIEYMGVDGYTDTELLKDLNWNGIN